jgi:sodium-dependent dicarboxylate transporter 2/3/5
MEKRPRRTTELIVVATAVLLYWVVGHIWTPPAVRTPWGEDVFLTPQAQRAAGILASTILLWITEAIPFAVTALLAVIIAPLLGITDGLQAMAGAKPVHGIAKGLDLLLQWGFGNRIVLFFLGVFLITAAVQRCNLGRRMALNLLARVGTSASRVLLAFLLGGTLISMWITDMAVSALLLPIGVGLLDRAGMEPGRSRFGAALMIACSWGATFGGIGTPAGCGPNPIAIAFLADLAGVEVSFVDWMKLGVPGALILVPLGWGILMLLFPPEVRRLPISQGDLQAEMRAMGPMTSGEVKTLSVFLGVACLWVMEEPIRQFTGASLPMEWVSMAGGVALFLPRVRVLTWSDAERLVPWGALLLVLASLSIGMLTYRTGAARWMAWLILGWIQGIGPVWQVAVVLAGVMAMKVFLASNTVSGVILIPLLIELARDLGLDPWFLVAPAAFSSSLGLLLVTQTPTHVIPYTSGYFTMKDFALAGALMSLVMVAALTLVLLAAGSLWGVYRI